MCMFKAEHRSEELRRKQQQQQHTGTDTVAEIEMHKGICPDLFRRQWGPFHCSAFQSNAVQQNLLPCWKCSLCSLGAIRHKWLLNT